MKQNKKRRRELDWLMWGCPLRGKCGADATGARLSKRVRLTRVDPKLSTPTNAPEIESFSAAQSHSLMSAGKHGKAYDKNLVYSRSAMLAISKDDMDACALARGITKKVKSIKMIRQLVYDTKADDGSIGTRFVRCVCGKCMARKWSACVCHAWTLGEPVWEKPR
jgi:hypothetical protein